MGSWKHYVHYALCKRILKRFGACLDIYIQYAVLHGRIIIIIVLLHLSIIAIKKISKNSKTTKRKIEAEILEILLAPVR